MFFVLNSVTKQRSKYSLWWGITKLLYAEVGNDGGQEPFALAGGGTGV